MSRRVKSPGPQVVDVLTQPDPEPAPAPDPTPDPIPDPGPLPATPARPVPEAQLTSEQRRIRELENQLALERGRKDPEQEFEPVPEDATDTIVIHFLEDGFTALGQVWYRGQELEFTPGSAAYADTCDRLGRSWLELRTDEFAQVERWGKVMFRAGPWPGKPLTEAVNVPFESLRPLKDGGTLTPSPAELEAALAAEAKRRRAAPRLPMR